MCSEEIMNANETPSGCAPVLNHRDRVAVSSTLYRHALCVLCVLCGIPVLSFVPRCLRGLIALCVLCGNPVGLSFRLAFLRLLSFVPRCLRGLIALCVLCVLCGNPFGSAFGAQPGSLDTGFNPGTGVDQSVFAIAVQSDGRIIIAGDFNTVNGTPHKGVARLATNGEVDPNFSAGDGPDDVVNAVALQGSKLIIGGYFSSVDTTSQPYIARLGTNGTLDTSFDTGTGPDGPVLALAVQPDGKVLLAGTFNTVDGIARTNIARLNSNGSVDMGFDPGEGVSAELFSSVNSIALQADGKVVIGGAFSKYDGTPRNNLARLNTNGVLDAQFTPFVGLAGAGVLAGVNALAIQGDGRILLGGDFTSASGSARTNLARLNSNGGVDLNFDPGAGPDAPVTSLAVQENRSEERRVGKEGR